MQKISKQKLLKNLCRPKKSKTSRKTYAISVAILIGISTLTIFALATGILWQTPRPLPPSNGDWVVNATESYENQTIVVNGNLIIESNGNLTLKNVTLIINSTYDGEFGITVNNGGEFYIYDYDNNSSTTSDRSIITSGNPDYHYTFVVNSGSIFEMKNSELSESGTGWGEGYYGLTIRTNNAVVQNNEVHDNYYGIVLSSSSNNNINGNDVHHNYYGIVLSSSSNNNINGNDVHHNHDGIQLQSANSNTIDYNNVHDNDWTNGIYLWNSHNNSINNNSVSYNNWAIWLDGSENNTIADNHVFNNINGVALWNFANNNDLLNNLIEDDDFSGYGIELYYSNFNYIYDNAINYHWYGIYLTYSQSNDFSANTLDGNSQVGIYFADEFSYYNSFADAVNGDEYYHILNANNFTLDGYILTAEKVSNTGKITLINCENITISNGTFSNNYMGGDGIFLYNSNYINIINNTMETNTYGILLDQSNNNLISGNTLNYNNRGVRLFGSSENNTIENNNGVDDYFGVSIEDSSDNNLIKGNIFSSGSYLISIYFSNGNTIENNELYSSYVGIVLSNSNDDIIESNEIYSNYYGIYLSFSNNNKILNHNNTINDNAYYGISLENSNNNLIDNNEVVNHYIGLYLFSSNNNQIQNSNIYNNIFIFGSYAVYSYYSNSNIYSNINTYGTHYDNFVLSGSNNNTINNTNSFNSTSGNGISLWSSNNNTIKNSNVYNNSNENGIRLNNSNENLIELNDIYNNFLNGIFIDPSNNNEITNNTIFDNGENGTFVWSSNNNYIGYNIFYNNTNGITIENSNNNTIINNNITNNAVSGIQLINSDENSIGLNSPQNNGVAGIHLTDSNNNYLNGNSAYSNFNGIVLDPSENNTLIGNEAVYNTNNGIIVFDSNNNILNGNIASANGNWGIYVKNSDNTQLIDNRAGWNTWGGINIEDADNALIQNAEVNDNIEVGIQLLNSQNAEVLNSNIHDNSNDAIGITNSNSTVVKNTDILNNGEVLIFNSQNVLFENDTVYSDGTWEFMVSSGSEATTINTTFNGSKVSCSVDSKLTVKNYLHIKTMYLDSSPLANSDVRIRDNGDPIYSTAGYGGANAKTDVNGLILWILITDRIYDGSNFATENTTTTEAKFNGEEKFLNSPRVVDMNISHTEFFLFDNIPPISTKLIGFPMYGEYVKSTTEFNLSATDEGGGVDKIYYRLWNGTWISWIEYSANFTLGIGDGLRYIEWYGVDIFGNNETIHNQTHYIDDTPPTSWKIIHEPNVSNDWVNFTTLFEANATDSGSGVLFNSTWNSTVFFVRVYNGPTLGSWSGWFMLGLPFIDDTTDWGGPDREFIIEWYAIDNLGNAENIHNQTHHLDNTPPTITKTISQPNYENNITTQTEFNLTASDSGVGLNSLEYRIWNGTWSSWITYTGNFTINGNEGVVHLEVRALDKLGNMAFDNQTYNLYLPITLEGSDDYALDTGGEAGNEFLVINLTFNITIEGNYKLVGELYNENGTILITVNETTVYLTIGMQNISLYLSGEDIYNSGIDSPYLLKWTLYIEGSWIEVANGSINITNTYNHEEFVPEFSMFIVPLVGIVVVFFVIRRRRE